MPTETETHTETEHRDYNAPLEQLELVPRNFHVSVLDGEQGAQTQEDLGFTIQRGEVILADDQTVDQYKRGLQFFQTLQHRQKEWFSSYVSKGRSKFGIQLVETALQQLEFDMPVVKAALDIATVPVELRHENLNAEHFLVLARAPGITPAKRASWAKTASQLKLSPGQLKASIAKGEVVSGKTAEHINHGILNVHGIAHEFSIWVRRIQGVDPGVLTMKLDEQDEIIRELKPVADFYNEIIRLRGTKPTKKLEKPASKTKPEKKPKAAKKKPAAKKAKVKKPAKKK